MTVKIIFVGQSFDGGKSMFGYHAQWNPAEQNMDPKVEARKIDELNKKMGHSWYDPSKSEFYIWEQEYDEVPFDELDKEKHKMFHSEEEIKTKRVYKGSSPKKRLRL
ncbi:MAG: hypothetical protein O2871_03400 [bacterium]|nr:hypothetical protein [bacterium]